MRRAAAVKLLQVALYDAQWWRISAQRTSRAQPGRTVRRIRRKTTSGDMAHVFLFPMLFHGLSLQLRGGSPRVAFFFEFMHIFLNILNDVCWLWGLGLGGTAKREAEL